jgi:hypothetical protein
LDQFGSCRAEDRFQRSWFRRQYNSFEIQW